MKHLKIESILDSTDIQHITVHSSKRKDSIQELDIIKQIDNKSCDSTKIKDLWTMVNQSDKNLNKSFVVNQENKLSKFYSRKKKGSNLEMIEKNIQRTEKKLRQKISPTTKLNKQFQNIFQINKKDSKLNRNGNRRKLSLSNSRKSSSQSPSLPKNYQKYQQTQQDRQYNQLSGKRNTLLRLALKMRQKNSTSSTNNQNQENLTPKNDHLPFLIDPIKIIAPKDQNIIKMKRGSGIVSKQKGRVAQNFIEMHKRVSPHIKLQDKLYRQKYDLDYYDDYLVKKTSKRIDQAYQKRQKNKNENIVHQFQNYLMHNITLSPKNKECIMKQFMKINRSVTKNQKK